MLWTRVTFKSHGCFHPIHRQGWCYRRVRGIECIYVTLSHQKETNKLRDAPPGRCCHGVHLCALACVDMSLHTWGVRRCTQPPLAIFPITLCDPSVRQGSSTKPRSWRCPHFQMNALTRGLFSKPLHGLFLVTRVRQRTGAQPHDSPVSFLRRGALLALHGFFSLLNSAGRSDRDALTDGLTSGTFPFKSSVRIWK